MTPKPDYESRYDPRLYPLFIPAAEGTREDTEALLRPKPQDSIAASFTQKKPRRPRRR